MSSKKYTGIVRGVLFLSLILCSCSVRSVYVRESSPRHVSPVPQDSIAYSLFLIGDAGESSATKKEMTFQTLIEQLSAAPSSSGIVFLGDNLYPSGLPSADHPRRKEMEGRLDRQIEIGKISGAMTIFVPGNHDWEYQGRDGVATLLREEEYIDAYRLPNVRMLPRGGVPGPVIVDINPDIRLIVIDTQWWLHAYSKPMFAGATTDAHSKNLFLDSLASGLRLSDNRRTIVAAHHPLRSHGEHGGFFEWTDHLFPLRKISPWLWIPLPGIGSLYPLSRMWGISDQDFSGSVNTEMRRSIDSVLSLYRPAVYVSGHEHTLQVLEKSAHHYYLVSGNGIEHHQEALTSGDDTILATRRKGYMRIDFLADGRMRLGVIAADEAGAGEIFSIMLR